MCDDLKAFKSMIAELKELCEEKAKDFDEFISTKMEQLKKEMEQFSLSHSTSKMEDAIGRLQAAWEDLRSCFKEIPSYKSRTVSNALCIQLMCMCNM